jgi:thiamine-phosphate pyrophosphorylase
MPARHPSIPPKRLPTLWLMTDERMGEALWSALARLPRGSGVVFRHFATEPVARAAIFARVSQIARRRRLTVVRAGVRRQTPNLHPAHSMREAIAARRRNADMILVSPIYPTRTHPGARTLGPLRAAKIARTAGIPAIALGGMTRTRFKRMKSLGFVGWAAIDGLTPR